MKLLIVDDEPLARARLRSMLQDHEEIDAFEEAKNGLEALSQCQKFTPDVVLMDIRMPGMDGLEAARHLSQEQQPPAVIFTTAYDDHALQAFDVQAIGYLVKPVNKEKLLQALANAKRLTGKFSQQISELQDQYFTARQGNEVQRVAVKDVLYFQADQKYVKVRHNEGELLLEDTLKRLEEDYAEGFIRIHRNALIAKPQIKSLVKLSNGQYVVKLRQTEEQLEVSRRHLPAIRQYIKDHQG